MGYIYIYIYIYKKVDEIITSFNNSSKYLDQAHPS
jgi:hypothetical protein